MNRTWKLGKGVPGERIQTTEEEGPCWLLLVPVGVGLSLGRVGDDWPSGGGVSEGHDKAASESIAHVCPLKGAAELT